MSLDFDGSSGNTDWGTEGVPTDFTYMVWVYPTSTTAEGVICTLSESDGSPLVGDMTDLSQDIGLFTLRATSNTFYQTDTTPLSPLDAWYFIAVTQQKDAAQEVHIYAGDRSTPASEQTYGTSNNGSGAYSLAAGNEVRYVAGDHDGAKPFPGRVGPVMVTHTVLSLRDILKWQFWLAPRPDAELYTRLGHYGTGDQHDWSTNRRTGSELGTPSVAPSLPIPQPWKRRGPLVVPVSAAGQTIAAPVASAVAEAPAPQVAPATTVSAPVADAQAESPAPQPLASVDLSPPVAPVVGESPAPGVAASAGVTPPVATSTADAPAPAPSPTVDVVSPVADAQAESPAPSVVSGDSVSAPVAPATAEAPAPIPDAPVDVPAPVAPATGEAPAPSMVPVRSLALPAIEAVVDPNAPAVSPGVAAMSLTVADALAAAPSPVVQAQVSAAAPGAAAVAEAPTPTVIPGGVDLLVPVATVTVEVPSTTLVLGALFQNVVTGDVFIARTLSGDVAVARELEGDAPIAPTVSGDVEV